MLIKRIILLLLLLNGVCFAQKKDPADYVDPFIGTSNSRWVLFPSPTLPFGMVKLSPDNQENVWGMAATSILWLVFRVLATCTP